MSFSDFSCLENPFSKTCPFSRSLSMVSDEPLATFKTGSNLVRAMDVAPEDLDSTRNSLTTRLQKNWEPNRVDRQLELKINTRYLVLSCGNYLSNKNKSFAL
jgi:hypothetical protein